MNVCLLNDSFPPVIDGVANTVKNYADILNRKPGTGVIVGTPRYPDADYSGYPYKVIDYESYDVTALVNGYRAGNPLAGEAISGITDFKPDIIHTHCPAASTIMARILRKETDAPIIFTYHTKFDVDIAVATESEFIRKESIKALVENVAACDEVWTVSKGAGDNLRSLGYNGDFIVMNNGVDFAKGRADENDIRRATEKYDLPAGVPLFLFVGRIMKYKGIPMILEALHMLSEDGIDFRMAIVGSGKHSDEIRAMAKDLGLNVYENDNGTVKRTDGRYKNGAVIFTGPVYDRNELRGWNTKADLFLFPSTYDTNGIVVREAAACALASVLIENSCAAEGITDRRNGYIIKETPQDMYRLLKEVSGNLEDTARVGQNAMNEIYISWEDSVNTAYKRYEDVLRMKAAGVLAEHPKTFPSYLLDTAADIIDKFSEVSRSTRELRDEFNRNLDGMKENFAEAEQTFEENKANMKNRLRSVGHNIKEELRKAWEDQILFR